MNSVGIKAEWCVIQGRPDFFNITKKMHNALQGAEINLSELKTSIFEEVNFENAVRNSIDHDMVLVHDPQPLALIDLFEEMSMGMALPHRALKSSRSYLGIPHEIHRKIRRRDSEP